MKALLKKKQKKTGQNKQSATKEDEEISQPAAAGANQDLTGDADSPAPKSATLKPEKDDNDESSEDESKATLNTGVKFIEQQANKSKEQEVVQADWLLQQEAKDEGAKDQKPKKVKDASNIQFAGKGRPTFTRNKNMNGLGGEGFLALDEIDDSGQQKKNQKKNTAAQGGREFEHLGSTAVDKTKKFEEEKESKPTGMRPRFTGKAKIGGGANNQSTGTNITYDFGVKYKTANTDNPDEKKNPDKKQDGSTNEVRKDKRNINKGARFGAKDQGLDDNDLDEGFEIVRDPNQKRRLQRQQNRNKDEDRDEDGAKSKGEPTGFIKRGGAFGNLGGNDSD